MSEEKDRFEPPKETGWDKAHALTKGVLGAIPIAGGLTGEVFSMVLQQPITKRRQEWMDGVADALNRLQERVEGFSIENLSQNEQFVTTLLYASQMAIRNTQQEKREALRNAVLNSALPNAPEEDLQLMFLEFVDTLTTCHLSLLSLCDDPRRAGLRNRWDGLGNLPASVGELLHTTYPHLDEMGDFSEYVARDLFTKGLIISDIALLVKLEPDVAWESMCSDIGKRFLAFITSPL